MTFKKNIKKKLKNLQNSKKQLENDYDELLSTFSEKGRKLETHKSYLTALDFMYNDIKNLESQIKNLESILKESY